jgi:hypothetical protein
MQKIRQTNKKIILKNTKFNKHSAHCLFMFIAKIPMDFKIKKIQMIFKIPIIVRKLFNGIRILKAISKRAFHQFSGNFVGFS